MALKARAKTKPAPKSAPKLSENARMAAGWRERIESEMTRQHFTLRGLSSRADLGNSTVRHLMKVADDISLGTLVKLADALGVSLVWLTTGTQAFYESGNSTGTRILLLPVMQPDLELREDAAQVPVVANKTPANSRALIITNNAMRAEGSNVPIDPAHILLAGDVVVFSPDVRPEIGELVVAQTPKGAVVRRLAQSDGGDLQLIANNATFPRLTTRSADVLGGVSLVIRSTSRA